MRFPLPSQGIIHRDIKPQNILLSAPIEDPVSVAKIADFGAAVFTFGIGKDKVSYGGTPHFQVRHTLTINNSIIIALQFEE